MRNHILVVTNETAEVTELHRTVRSRGPDPDVLVVAPALNSRLHHLTSDEDGARAAAQARLDRCLARLRGADIQAEGRIGDADPIQAIADALADFPADELVIATDPEEHSNWRARHLVERAREGFGLPTAAALQGAAA